MSNNIPYVSILTPVYNGEKYLAECIESVLAQTYGNWEYIIVDNCSTDQSADIARSYASRDSRITVHSYNQFVGLIENHNRAFRLISPDSKYCKVVSADDWIFPECIVRMVEVAEENPSVGIVGSYQLSGSNENWRVRNDELPYPSIAVSGRTICRLHLLTDTYVFGNPTSSLYRSDIVRETNSFFPNLTAEADASACFKYLQYADFGFVHQVLSYERIHEGTQTTICRDLNTYKSAKLSDLLTYGPSYLTKDELERRIEEVLDAYYKFLAISAVNNRNKDFYSYHKKRLEELGRPLDRIRMSKAICMKILDLLCNPKQTIEKAYKRFN
jgi:glycosyltransferase involved in cell wall biosynthesis